MDAENTSVLRETNIKYFGWETTLAQWEHCNIFK